MPKDYYHSAGAERKLMKAGRKGIKKAKGVAGAMMSGLKKSMKDISNKSGYEKAGKALHKTGKRAKARGFKFGG